MPVIYVDYPGEASLKQIYGTFNRAMLKLIPPLRTYAGPLTNAMVDFFLQSRDRFTQDMQPHYVYSPREMTRWVRGICEAIRPLESMSIEELIRLWAHEALRLFPTVPTTPHIAPRGAQLHGLPLPEGNVM